MLNYFIQVNENARFNKKEEKSEIEAFFKGLAFLFFYVICGV